MDLGLNNPGESDVVSARLCLGSSNFVGESPIHQERVMKKILCVFAFFGLLFAGAAYAAPCLNIDKASAKDIEKNLKGAGPAKAKAIIAHRAAARAAATKAGKKTWNFQNWKTLLKVKGLGPKFCTDNVGQVCFANKTTPQKVCPKVKAAVKKAVKAKAKDTKSKK